jgi:ferredoxin-NADP reductase
VTDTAPGSRAPAGGKRIATVRSVSHPNPHAVILRLEVPDRIDHVPGQHYTIRLTAEDGYVAQRSYSLASPPSDPLLEFYVERLDDGEVSTFLADVVEPGDELEIRGPIGGWFVWTADRPALGLGGGSGVVPLLSMLRHARDVGQESLLRIAVSARTRADLPYADELEAAGALIVLTARGRRVEPTGDRRRHVLHLRLQLLRRSCQRVARRRRRTHAEHPGRAIRPQRVRRRPAAV